MNQLPHMTAPDALAAYFNASVGDTLTERLFELLNSLAQAPTARQLRRLLERQAMEYVPVSVMLGHQDIAYCHIASKTVAQVLQELDAAGWGGLTANGEPRFSKLDLRLLREALQIQQEVVELDENTPQENRAFLVRAILQGYWALSKLDLCASAVLLLVEGKLQSEQPEITHWLCLACRPYIKEWQSALFQNNPELWRRLLDPNPETVTLEEVKRRLGLAD